MQQRQRNKRIVRWGWANNEEGGRQQVKPARNLATVPSAKHYLELCVRVCGGGENSEFRSQNQKKRKINK